MHSSSSGVFSSCRVAASVLFKPGFQTQVAVLLGSHHPSEISPFLPPMCQFYLLLFSHSVMPDSSGTVALQAPLPMGFFRHEYWSGLPFPPPGDLPNPRIEPTSPSWQVDFFFFLTTEPPGKPCQNALISTRTQDLSVLSITTLCLHSVTIRVYVAPW